MLAGAVCSRDCFRLEHRILFMQPTFSRLQLFGQLFTTHLALLYTFQQQFSIGTMHRFSSSLVCFVIV